MPFIVADLQGKCQMKCQMNASKVFKPVATSISTRPARICWDLHLGSFCAAAESSDSCEWREPCGVGSFLDKNLKSNFNIEILPNCQWMTYCDHLHCRLRAPWCAYRCGRCYDAGTGSATWTVARQRCQPAANPWAQLPRKFRQSGTRSQRPHRSPSQMSKKIYHHAATSPPDLGDEDIWRRRDRSRMRYDECAAPHAFARRAPRRRRWLICTSSRRVQGGASGRGEWSPGRRLNWGDLRLVEVIQSNVRKRFFFTFSSVYVDRTQTSKLKVFVANLYFFAFAFTKLYYKISFAYVLRYLGVRSIYLWL